MIEEWLAPDIAQATRSGGALQTVVRVPILLPLGYPNLVAHLTERCASSEKIALPAIVQTMDEISALLSGFERCAEVKDVATKSLRTWLSALERSRPLLECAEAYRIMRCDAGLETLVVRLRRLLVAEQAKRIAGRKFAGPAVAYPWECNVDTVWPWFEALRRWLPEDQQALLELDLPNIFPSRRAIVASQA